MTEARAKIEAAIAAERAAWQALSQAERVEYLRAQQLAAEARELDRDRVSGEKLDAIMASFRAFAAQARVMSPAEEAEWNWEHRTRGQLKSLGLDEQHIRRIAPDWNCPQQAYTFEVVKRMCVGKGAIIVLAGARGTGKTQLCAELMRERVEAEFSWNDADPGSRTGNPPRDPGRYEKLAVLGAMFKALYADFGSITQERAANLLAAWCRLPLLVIDEIHEQDGLVTHQRLLTDLCDRRYAAGHDTILITNHEAREFREKVNPSILSRIGQFGAILPCEWRSWRSR